MSDVAGVMVRQRHRISEIARVLRRYGFARLAANAAAATGESGSARASFAERNADPALVQMSAGARLRSALSELGTTWIKFGQMLSLRPDIVGVDVADELSKLQAAVPADAPGLAEKRVAGALGMPVADAFATFESDPMASGSVAQVHRAILDDGTPVAVKVLHDGAEERVVSDLELMSALATFAEANDPELARFSPTTLVAEFDTMMRAAIDLTQELDSLKTFRANFAEEPDVLIPKPYPERSAKQVLTMELMTGRPFADRAALERDGWDVDALSRRASDIYLEMVFRDGIYHADPHPGNFLLPDPEHIAILDFGDVGRLTGARKEQLEDLLLAVSKRSVDGVTDAVIEITDAPADVDVNALRGDIDLWLSRYLKGSVADLDTSGMLRSGSALLRKHRLTFPSDLALLFRVLLRLQGLGQRLGTSQSITDLLEPYLRRMTLERLDPRRLAHRLVRATKSWERLLTSLPDDVRKVFGQLRAGTVAVDFKVHDTDGSVPQLVDGILASASILAASQLLSRKTGPLIAGVSVPGAVSVAVGVVTWHRLQMKRPGYRKTVTRILNAVKPRS
ncbi:ABC1 kinase family protein [Leifsonia sp. NPDC058230]|uniref:ABC1 kinase family protein n=1 Tax=Leifsonia sp. NPDC058230 TaxID=3346391 RepID=UPI0036DDCDCF